LLFYMCHFAMGLTHCHKTTVFFTLIAIQSATQLRVLTERHFATIPRT